MKKILALSALCCVVSGVAGVAHADWFGLKDSAPAVASGSVVRAGGSGQLMKTARVRWLDKQTNRTQVLIFQSGTTQMLGGLNVAMSKCLADYGGVPGQDVAWLEVREDKRAAPWFAGWMFNTYPEVATLDHPRYDMALVGCGEQARAKAVAPVKANEVKDAAPLSDDSEAPQGRDSESKGAANDPYYVPGVENAAKETPAPAGAALAVTPTEVPTGGQPGQPVPVPAAQPTPPAQPQVRPMAVPAAPAQPSVQATAVPEGQRIQAVPASVTDPEALQQLMDQR